MGKIVGKIIKSVVYTCRSANPFDCIQLTVQTSFDDGKDPFAVVQSVHVKIIPERLGMTDRAADAFRKGGRLVDSETNKYEGGLVGSYVEINIGEYEPCAHHTNYIPVGPKPISILKQKPKEFVFDDSGLVQERSNKPKSFSERSTVKHVSV